MGESEITARDFVTEKWSKVGENGKRKAYRDARKESRGENIM